MEIYADLIKEQGRQVVSTSISRLQTEDGLQEFLEFVGASESILNDPEFVVRRSKKINQKLEMKRIADTPLLASEMLNWANEVDKRLTAQRS